MHLYAQGNRKHQCRKVQRNTGPLSTGSLSQTPRLRPVESRGTPHTINTTPTFANWQSGGGERLPRETDLQDRSFAYSTLEGGSPSANHTSTVTEFSNAFVGMQTSVRRIGRWKSSMTENHCPDLADATSTLRPLTSKLPKRLSSRHVT